MSIEEAKAFLETTRFYNSNVYFDLEDNLANTLMAWKEKMNKSTYKRDMARIAAITKIIDYDPTSTPRTVHEHVIAAIMQIAHVSLGNPSYSDMNKILGNNWRSRDWKQIAYGPQEEL